MLGRKIGLLFMERGILQVLGLFSLVFVARYLGSEALGIVGFAISFVGLFTIVADLGFVMGHKKKISEGEDLGTCVGTYSLIKICLITLMTVSVILTVHYYEFIFNENLSSEQESVIYIILISTVITLIGVIPKATFEARKEIAKSTIPNIFSKLVGTISRISVSLMGLSVLFLAFTQIIGTLTFLLLSLYFFRNYPVSKPSKRMIKDYTLFSYPLMFAVVLAQIVHHLDKFMVGFYTSIEDLGVYVAVAAITKGLMLIQYVFNRVLFPTISEKTSEGNLEYVEKIISSGVRYLILLTLPIVIIVSIFSEEIITFLLGKEFSEGDSLLQLMIINLFLLTISSPYNTQIIGSGYSMLAAKIGVFIFSVNIILNIVMIPENLFNYQLLGYGAYGAALATLLSTLFLFFIVRFYSYKLFKTSFQGRQAIIFLSVTILLSFVLNLAKENYSDINYLFPFIISFLGFISFYFMLFILNEFNKKDIDFIINSIHPRKMLDYIRDELKE